MAFSKKRAPKLKGTSVLTQARQTSPFGLGYNKSGTPRRPSGENLKTGGKKVGVSKSGGKGAPGVKKLISEGGTEKLKAPRGSGRQPRDRRGRWS